MSTIGIVCCWVAVVWGRGHMMGKECSLVAKHEISRQCALHMYNIALVFSSDIHVHKYYRNICSPGLLLNMVIPV